ncbi:MAG: tetratricopeptide repeat protein [Thermodesulfobacteriota bacterium]
MQTRNIVLLIVAAVALAVVGFGGYFIGASGSRTTVASGVTSAGGGARSYDNKPLNYSSIIEDLKAQLAEKPDDPDLVAQLGHAYFEQKRFDEASEYYKKTIELTGGNADMYNDLGLSMHYQGNSAGGLGYIDKGIKENPYNQRIWLTKGFLLAYGMDDIEGARKAWEKAAALDPTSQIGKAAADYLSQVNSK